MGLKTKLFLVVLLLVGYGVHQFWQDNKYENLQTKHKFRIYRDEHGVPRIYARNKLSAFYAFGFA